LRSDSLSTGGGYRVDEQDRCALWDRTIKNGPCSSQSILPKDDIIAPAD
jgi:hypothetical protein